MLSSRTERWYKRAAGRKSDVICIFLLCVLTLVTWIPRSRGPIDLRWDAGVYYVLGTSLAQGKGYRLLNEPGEIQDIQYPPLLPAIVALHQTVLGTSDPVVVGRWLRVTWILLSLLYVALAFVLGRVFLPLRYALLLALACMLAYEMYFLSTLLFTELPFAITTMLFAVLYYRADQSQLSRMGAAVGAIASYLLRTVGIAALAAWVLDALLRSQFRSAAIRAVVALVPVLMWQGYIHSVQTGYEYTHPRYSYQRDPSMFYNVSYATNVALKDPFHPELGNASARDLAARFLGNAVAAPGDLGEAVGGRKDFWEHYVFRVNGEARLSPLPVWPIIRLTLYLIGALTLAGIALQLWRRQWALGLYVLLSLAALGTSPWPAQTLRYLSPLLPFFLLSMFGCVRWLTMMGGELPWKAARLGSTATAAYVSLFVVVGSALTFGPWYHNFLGQTTYQGRDGVNRAYTLVNFPQSYAAFQAALRWLKARPPRDAIVAVSMPHWAYLETGLKSVMTPFQDDPTRAQRLLDSVPISYVILETTGSHDKHLPALIRSSGERWQLVYSSIPSGAQIYRRVRRDTSASTGSRTQ